MQLTTTLAFAVGFFLFTAIFTIFMYKRYDGIAGDEEGKVILLIISCITGLSSLGFGALLIYRL